MTESSELTASRLRSRIIDSLGVPTASPWYVAYSGGLDSTVLLHALVRIATPGSGIRLVALHADHDISPNAPSWHAHCVRWCAEWGIECRTTRLNIDDPNGLGTEGRAREARYRWFREHAGEGGWLITAHHRGDQAETVIERLVRGSGPRGLRGMRPVARLYGMNVARPLLGFPRETLMRYAGRHQLDWVEDESNDDTRLTRNYIRGKVLPILSNRWPGVEAAVARTAAAMADAESILQQTAAADLEKLNDRSDRGDRCLCVKSLRTLDEARQRNVLRYWVHRERGVVLSRGRLKRVMNAVRDYPQPRGGMHWPPVTLRFHRGRLYLLRPEESPVSARYWDLQNNIDIGNGMTLRARRIAGGGLKTTVVGGGVEVCFRRGGERCRLPGRRHHHTLKHVLQEAGVPPWQRSKVPLIKIDGEIAAVPGLAYCAPYAAGPGENGIEIEVAHEPSPVHDSP